MINDIDAGLGRFGELIFGHDQRNENTETRET